MNWDQFISFRAGLPRWNSIQSETNIAMRKAQRRAVFRDCRKALFPLP
jgi:hypothetical protein